MAIPAIRGMGLLEVDTALALQKSEGFDPPIFHKRGTGLQGVGTSFAKKKSGEFDSLVFHRGMGLHGVAAMFAP